MVGVWIWTLSAEEAAHRKPEVARISIEEILKKESLADGDYPVLSEQTGLSEEALRFLEEQGRRQEINDLQELYFTPIRIVCEPNSILSNEEHVANEQGDPVKGMRIPYVEEGDILITCCSHFLGWRNGHAGIVVDAERRLVLEAQVLGSPSVITSLDRWEEYPSFLVLRLKGADREARAEIAEYALANLIGLPYRLTAGFFDREGEVPSGTQCAHLVWYAYQRFGYDLDSDGGFLVTPKDIAGSEDLIMIQKFGM